MCFQPHKRPFYQRCKNCFAVFLLLPLACFAQQKQIDSLKKILPQLTDTARVDALCALSLFYFFAGQSNAVDPNIETAIREAQKIVYAHGLGVANNQKASLLFWIRNDYPSALYYVRQSLQWFAQTNNKTKKQIDEDYWLLGKIKTEMGEYDEALDTLELDCRLFGNIYEDNCLMGGPALETMTDIYRERGEYVKLLETQQKLVAWDRQRGDTSDYSFHESWVLGLMYRLLGDYRTAIPFWRKVFMGYMGGNIGAWNTMEYAELMMYAGDPTRPAITMHDSTLCTVITKTCVTSW